MAEHHLPEQQGASGAQLGSGRLGAWLTAILAVPVLGFFSFAAWNPSALRVPLATGGTPTIWYAYGLGLIGFSLLLSLIYVVVTNRAADRAARMMGLAGLAMLLPKLASAAPVARRPADSGRWAAPPAPPRPGFAPGGWR